MSEVFPNSGAIGYLHRKGAHIQLHESCERNNVFLPLPLQNTLDRLDEAGFRAHFSTDDIMSTLPDPELYIIVDGRPTKDKVVWQSIVDVDNVRHAVEKFKETNWLYRTVNEDSVDEATKKTIEVVSLASNPILERASVDDINGLQAYTIRIYANWQRHRTLQTT